MVSLAILGIVIGALFSLIALKTVESKAAKTKLILGGSTVGGFFGAVAGFAAAWGLEPRVPAEKQPITSSNNNVNAAGITTPKYGLT